MQPTPFLSETNLAIPQPWTRKAQRNECTLRERPRTFLNMVYNSFLAILLSVVNSVVSVLWGRISWECITTRVKACRKAAYEVKWEI